MNGSKQQIPRYRTNTGTIMQCPWETAIFQSYDLPDQEGVDYLTSLSLIIAQYIVIAPTEVIPHRPPQLPIGQQTSRTSDRHETKNRRNVNRFQDIASDDDSEADTVLGHAKLNLQLPAGDATDPDNNSSGLCVEDIYIRALTTRGEILCKLGRRMSKVSKWTDSAALFMQAVRLINLALDHANEIHAKMESEPEKNHRERRKIGKRVKLNANVVHIAATGAMKEKEQFEKEAQKRKQLLENRLAPQWRSRDEVKARMGEEAWRRNPHPKKDYALRREADEQELRDLTAALDLVLTADFAAIRDGAEALRRKV
jgi:hypothetical protein